MIPEPKFQIGEEVLVRAPYSPKLNCETMVTHMEYRQSTHRYTGEITTGWFYKTASTMEADWWRESNLRKKHQPGDQSFSELMSSLGGRVVA